MKCCRHVISVSDWAATSLPATALTCPWTGWLATRFWCVTSVIEATATQCWRALSGLCGCIWSHCECHPGTDSIVLTAFSLRQCCGRFTSRSVPLRYTVCGLIWQFVASGNLSPGMAVFGVDEAFCESMRGSASTLMKSMLRMRCRQTCQQSAGLMDARMPRQLNACTVRTDAEAHSFCRWQAVLAGNYSAGLLEWSNILVAGNKVQAYLLPLRVSGM